MAAFHRRFRHQKLVTIIFLLFIPLSTCFTTKSSLIRNAKQARRRRIVVPNARAPPIVVLSATSAGHDSLYTRYMHLLDTRPLLTKSLSSGVVSVLGDVLAQWIEAQKAHIPLTLKWIRLSSFFLCNTLFVGPFLHVWWSQLWKLGRWMKHKHNASRRLQILAQLVVDQTCGVAMFFPAYFYAYEFAEALMSWQGTVE